MRHSWIFISLACALALWIFDFAGIRGPLIFVTAVVLLNLLGDLLEPKTSSLSIILLALFAGLIFQDLFALLAFVPFFIFRPFINRPKSISGRTILRINYLILAIVFFQSVAGYGYDYVYRERVFVGFTENPNMLAYIITSLLALSTTISQELTTTRKDTLLSVLLFTIAGFTLLKCGSRNALAPFALLLLISFAPKIPKHCSSPPLKLGLIFIPLLIPVIVSVLHQKGQLSQDFTENLRRDSWFEIASLEELQHLEVGLNTFFYLNTSYGPTFLLLFCVGAVIWSFQKRSIPVAFFAIWMMGIFEPYLVSFSYGGSLLIMLISNSRQLTAKEC